MIRCSCAGAAYAQNNINEGDLQNQASASDQKTSALPSLKDVFKNFGGGSAPGAPASQEPWAQMHAACMLCPNASLIMRG